MKRLRYGKKIEPTETPQFIAYVLIKIEGELKESIRRLKRIPGVKKVHAVTGEYDVITKLEAENEDQIRNLVNQMKVIDSIKGTLTLNVKPPQPKTYRDVESRIKEVIGETGEVSSKYGGYEVVVINESMFPWPIVFRLLLEYQLEIWVSQRKDNIVISCKPPSA